MFEQILRIELRSGCNCRYGGGRFNFPDTDGNQFPDHLLNSVGSFRVFRYNLHTKHLLGALLEAQREGGGLVREICLRDVAHYLLCWPSTLGATIRVFLFLEPWSLSHPGGKRVPRPWSSSGLP